MSKLATSSGFKRIPQPVFHLQTKDEEEGCFPEVLKKQARKTGKLNLSDKNLTCIPDDVFKLGEVHSETKDVDLGENCDISSGKWWELEPLKYLDLSSNCISEIPKQINELDSLNTLNLHQNNLTEIPAQLGHLTNLTKLDLAYNRLTALPMELVGLKNLKSLYLSQNLFKTFPECIFDLVMLNQLDISNNELNLISPGIGFLTRLTHLNLSNNQLKSIPEDISCCRALLDLDLSKNKLTSDGLPHLGGLHNVETIHLQYNNLTLLPKLNGCSNLKEIHLAFNEMEEITIEELSTLSHLQIINLRNNRLRKIPKEVSCLQNLIRLDLSNNDLKELPATLSLLPHLENLQVDGNGLRTIRRDIITGGTVRLLKYLKQTLPLSEEDMKIVSKLPCCKESELPNRHSMRSSRSLNLSSQGLCNIPEVVFTEALEVPCSMVDLSKNKLTEIPEKMWILARNLTDINLSHNQLSSLPDDIGKCMNLEYLSLQLNQLTTLPSGLSKCIRLRELNLSFNKFQEIPSCIYDLKALQLLLINDNKVTEINAEGMLQLTRLAHLDLSNNNLASVPPLMGKMIQLRTFQLDGNGLRAPRPAILAKGTEAVLSWLRDKIV
ncbi:UNVERIFIED_CONTAM: hypothetical protein PYX00_002456 [Menopon gallinae]|uniref:Disease resistance R13L4/SHOC-2-like LRR domain-containing protein n=1 Tax=Menopon gallinae TaxID=328185 RepID=A0AAW2IH32_9NEOP